MRLLPVEIRSGATEASLAPFLERATRQPVVLTDAIDHWSARQKWTFDFFQSHFPLDGGIVAKDLHQTFPAKITTLGAYIRHLNDDEGRIPGFWTDDAGSPLRPQPEAEPLGLWNFSWKSFDRHPELRNDIRPFPLAVPNAIAELSPDELQRIESICDKDLFSIYIARKGTVSPMHADFWKTFGLLAQMQGRKAMRLIDPKTTSGADLSGFEAENPDFERFPSAASASIYGCVLEPGQSILIPPGWLHHTRCIDACITLSCNFFNRYNLDEFIPHLERKCFQRPTGASDLAKIKEAIGRIVPDSGQA
jgi:Cupin-like domain